VKHGGCSGTAHGRNTQCILGNDRVSDLGHTVSAETSEYLVIARKTKEAEYGVMGVAGGVVVRGIVQGNVRIPVGVVQQSSSIMISKKKQISGSGSRDLRNQMDSRVSRTIPTKMS